MMKKLILIIALMISNVSLAQQGNFCSSSRAPSYFNSFFDHAENRLDFVNQGGLINGGVCWWHSRFTRNSAYLARFNEYLPAPSETETKRIIKNLRRGKSIIEINGYANLREFSRENEDLIQKELEKWQRFDGFIRQQWVVGLWGWHRLPVHKLRARVEHLYDYVERDKKIAYLKLQVKGITAHSWLVTGIQKLSDGYRFKIIDSNYRRPITYRYRYGDRSFDTNTYGPVVPYLGKTKENNRISTIRKSFCRQELTL